MMAKCSSYLLSQIHGRRAVLKDGFIMSLKSQTAESTENNPFGLPSFNNQYIQDQIRETNITISNRYEWKMDKTWKTNKYISVSSSVTYKVKGDLRVSRSGPEKRHSEEYNNNTMNNGITLIQERRLISLIIV
jgi:hypothetical protein